MIKTMNWGKATIVILLAFVLFIGGMSAYMFISPVDDYDHQYYENGLNFDHDYNQEKQVTKDHAQPEIQIDTCCIKFIFPQTIAGTVKFMRPSSDAADITYPINNENHLPIQLLTTHITKGRWQLVFEWTSDKKTYLYQKEVYIK
jgi:FixH